MWCLLNSRHWKDLPFSKVSLLPGTGGKAVILSYPSSSMKKQKHTQKYWPYLTFTYQSGVRVSHWSDACLLNALALLPSPIQPSFLPVYPVYLFSVDSCVFLSKIVYVYMIIHIFFFQVEFPYILILHWQQKREFHLALEVPTNYPVTDPWIEPSLHRCLRAHWLSWSFSSNTSNSWRSRSNTSNRSTWIK